MQSALTSIAFQLVSSAGQSIKRSIVVMPAARAAGARNSWQAGRMHPKDGCDADNTITTSLISAGAAHEYHRHRYHSHWGSLLFGIYLNRNNSTASDWAIGGGSLGIFHAGRGCGRHSHWRCRDYGVAGDVISEGLGHLWYG